MMANLGIQEWRATYGYKVGHWESEENFMFTKQLLNLPQRKTSRDHVRVILSDQILATRILERQYRCCGAGRRTTQSFMYVGPVSRSLKIVLGRNKFSKETTHLPDLECPEAPDDAWW